MNTLQEIEAAIPKLSPKDIVRLQAWLDDYCEDHLDLTDEVKAALEEAKRDIELGRYKTRQPA
jgi:ABC-type Zn uptake system ZnuABC Zn-binding protein ZnuA